MPAPADLSEIIENSVSDAELPLEEPGLEASDDDLTHVEEPHTTASEGEPEATTEETPEVSSPASKGAAPAQDDFEKKFGIPQNSPTGRENRIPYSRVKRITEKAEKDTETRIRAEYAPKLSETEAKVKEYETKLSTYEGRLQQYGRFEQILDRDPVQMLTMLFRLPQYQPYLRPLFEAPAQQETQPQAPAVDPNADMPQPDQKLPDGSMVYSMDGLAKLNAWNRAQAAKEAQERTLQAVEAKFGPIYSEWEQHQRVQAVLPKVQAQIAEARKWPQFNENEAEIVKALQADQNLSLEGAYRNVVLPKLATTAQSAVTDRAQLEKEIRAKVLQEIKQTPRSTSTSAGTTKPSGKSTFVSTGSGDGDDKLTSIIRSAIRQN